MTKGRRHLCLGVAALALAACNREAGRASGAGQAYYKALNCRACHTIGNDNAGRAGPDLTLVGFHKTAAWLDRWLSNPQAWKPAALMPNPRLSEETRKAIVEYLSSLKGQDWGQQRPWNEPGLLKDPVERGQLLYARAGCVSCHGRAGVPGSPNNNTAGGRIAALVNLSQTYTKEALKQKIARGVAPAKAGPQGVDALPRMPAWSEILSPDEIDAVAEYLWTLVAPNEPGSSVPRPTAR